MRNFLRRLIGGLDNRHEAYRAERKATVFAAPIGPRPSRTTHPDFIEPDPPGGIEAAETLVETRKHAMERERLRRGA